MLLLIRKRTSAEDSSGESRRDKKVPSREAVRRSPRLLPEPRWSDFPEN
jgi:hypothetical protein